MRVGVFTPGYNVGNRAVLEAFAAGIPGAFVADDGAYRDCDVMAIFGLVKRAFPKSEAKGALMRRHRGPVVVLERGFMRREEYWSVGIGGINGRADFGNRESPADRFDALGVDLRPWSLDGDHALVCGQVPWDVSVQNTDHIAWCRRAVESCRRLGLPVRFRPHPHAARRGVDYGVDCEVSAASLEEDLARARLVVTYNSNTGVDAVISGRPTVAAGTGSMVWGLVPDGVRDEALLMRSWPDRRQWAADLAYAQWTMNEMREGRAWRHIAKALH